MRRRDVLIGAGLAALGACAPKGARKAGASASSRETMAVPTGEAARWAGYSAAMAIDGAAALNLPWFDELPPEERDRNVAADLAAAKASGLTAVITTVAPAGRFWLTDAAFAKTQKDIAVWKDKIAQHPDVLTHVLTAADLDAAHRDKKLGTIFTFQGTEPLGEDADRVKLFHDLGVRVIQLTHNRRNLVGDGCMEPSQAGLSRLGYEIVERLNDARIVVDVAHAAPRTIHDGIAASKRPMLISHTGCRALSDVPRCTPDAELRLLAERGGVAGMIFWPYLRTDTQPLAIDVIRHIEHAINVAGEDHVGIGTDMSVTPADRSGNFERDNREMIADMVKQGIFAKGRPADLYMFIPDLNMANRFEVLGAMLKLRGHSDARIAKILGGNVARVLREVWG